MKNVFYGNCVAKGIPCLVTANLTTRLFEVSGNVNLRSKKEYYDELVSLGVLQSSDISADYFPDITAENGERVNMTGELSDKPEYGYYLGFYADGRVLNWFEGMFAGFATTRKSISVVINKFIWKDDTVEVGFQRIKCPFCGDFIDSSFDTSITSWDTAFDPHGDKGHVMKCPGCKTHIVVASNSVTPNDVFRVLINYAEGLHLANGEPEYLNEEKINRYLGDFDTRRVLLPKLTAYNPKDKTPSTLYYLYAVKRIRDTV